MRLTDEDYWNLSYKNFIFQDIKEGAIFDLLSKYLDKVEGKSSLEIGSFPGTLIPIVGRKGYIVHGVDYNSRNGVDLPNWLKSLNLQVGKFWVSDFFTFKSFFLSFNSSSAFDKKSSLAPIIALYSLVRFSHN